MDSGNPKYSSGIEQQHVPDTDHADNALYFEKHFLEDTVPCVDKLVSLDVKETNCTAMTFSKGSTCLSASCAQVMWISDTTSRILASITTKYRCSCDSQSAIAISQPRLGINPMIQPEPEDLPKDNPKLEIAVLRWQSAQASEY
ncbi:hypothetical protein Tco_1430960 [Tanacetum coccineum]